MYAVFDGYLIEPLIYTLAALQVVDSSVLSI